MKPTLVPDVVELYRLLDSGLGCVENGASDLGGAA